MFLLVPAYPGCPGSKAVKRSLLLYPLFKNDLIHDFYVDLNLFKLLGLNEIHPV